MTKIIIINKNTNIDNKNIKEFNIQDLYKKCGFRNADNFKCHHTFKYKQLFIHIFGKLVGRANNENKYELPPPIDTCLFYGNIVCIASTNSDIINNTSTITDLNIDIFNQFIEYSFGGFDDIHSVITEESDSLEDNNNDLKINALTKEGYIKDDFVVSDNDGDSCSEVDVDIDIENNIKKSNSSGSEYEEDTDEDEEYYESELEEEPYLSE